MSFNISELGSFSTNLEATKFLAFSNPSFSPKASLEYFCSKTDLFMMASPREYKNVLFSAVILNA